MVAGSITTISPPQIERRQKPDQEAGDCVSLINKVLLIACDSSRNPSVQMPIHISNGELTARLERRDC
jgi:hypothetical protein